MRESDAVALAPLYGDERVKNSIGGDPISATRAGAEEWAKHGYGPFTLRAGAAVIGIFGFIWSTFEHGNDVEKLTEIVEAERRKGFATEASEKLIEWFFASHPHNRLIAFCTESNQGSRGLLRRLRFTATDQWRPSLSSERERLYVLTRPATRRSGGNALSDEASRPPSE
jgi:RimJ/RimL family protein N-acetyltransferase